MAVMSTDPFESGQLNGLPDESSLQDLANQFFTAPPVPQGATGGIPSSVAGTRGLRHLPDRFCGVCRLCTSAAAFRTQSEAGAPLLWTQVR